MKEKPGSNREDGRELMRAANAMSEEDKQRLLAEQSRERVLKMRRKIVIEELTNAQILAMEQFREFCKTKEIELTKRQVGKHREEFSAWFNQKQDKLFESNDSS